MQVTKSIKDILSLEPKDSRQECCAKVAKVIVVSEMTLLPFSVTKPKQGRVCCLCCTFPMTTLKQLLNVPNHETMIVVQDNALSPVYSVSLIKQRALSASRRSMSVDQLDTDELSELPNLYQVGKERFYYQGNHKKHFLDLDSSLFHRETARQKTSNTTTNAIPSKPVTSNSSIFPENQTRAKVSSDMVIRLRYSFP